MSEDISFKKLDIEHLPRMMEIERAAFPIAWSASVMRDSIRAAHCQTWGLYFQNNLIGYGILSIIFDEAEVLSMSIDPIYHQRGFGQKLLAHLMGTAKSKKAKNLYLEVRVSNKPAINLYQKKGFEQTGFRKNYYPTQGSMDREDALVLSSVL